MYKENKSVENLCGIDRRIGGLMDVEEKLVED